MPSPVPLHRSLSGFLSLKKVIRRAKHGLSRAGSDDVELPESPTTDQILQYTSYPWTGHKEVTVRQAIALESSSNGSNSQCDTVDPISLPNQFLLTDENPGVHSSRSQKNIALRSNVEEAVHNPLSLSHYNSTETETYPIPKKETSYTGLSFPSTSSRNNPSASQPSTAPISLLQDDVSSDDAHRLGQNVIEGGSSRTQPISRTVLLSIEGMTIHDGDSDDVIAQRQKANDQESDSSQSIVPLPLSIDTEMTVPMSLSEPISLFSDVPNYQAARIADELGLFLTQVSSISDEYHLQLQVLPSATQLVINENPSILPISSVSISLPHFKSLVATLHETSMAVEKTKTNDSLLSYEKQWLDDEAMITNAQPQDPPIAPYDVQKHGDDRFALIQRIDQLEEAKTLLEDRLSTERDGPSFLSQEDNLMESRVVKRLNSLLKERNEVVRHLEEQVQSAHNLLRSAVSKNESTATQLKTSQDRLADLLNQARINQEILEELQSSRRRVDQLETQLENKTSDVFSITNELEISQSTITELRSQLTDHAETTFQLRESRNQNAQLKAQLETQRADCEVVTSKLAASRSLVNELRRQLAVLETNIAELNRGRKRIKELKAEVQSKVSDSEALSDKLQSSRHQINQMKGQLLGHEERASELQKARKQIIELQDELRKATDFESLSFQLQNSRRRTTQLQTSLTKHKATTRQLKTAKIRIEELNTELAEHTRMAKLSKKEHNVTKLNLALSQSDLESTYTALLELANSFDSLGKKNAVLQACSDALLHKVTTSERRIRMLNNVLPRHSGVRCSSDIPRGRNSKPKQPSQEIIWAVRQLNQTISEAASQLAQCFLTYIVWQTFWPVDAQSCKVALGDRITSIILDKGLGKLGYPFLWYIIEIFLVSWSEQIIEAWYPKKRSFSETLISIRESMCQTTAGSIATVNGTTYSHVFSRMHHGSESPDLRPWSNDILGHLLRIIPVSLNDQDRNEIILPAIQTLVHLSYDLRLALAEEDICGNLQLLVYPPEIPFIPHCMDTTADISNSGISILSMVDDLKPESAGTIGLGLQSMSSQKSDADTPMINATIVIPPTVVLAEQLLQQAVFANT